MPDRRFQVWHDRAVFHFLTEEHQRRRYRALLAVALTPGAVLVMATFAVDGPAQCSGLQVRGYRRLWADRGTRPRVGSTGQPSRRTPHSIRRDPAVRLCRSTSGYAVSSVTFDSRDAMMGNRTLGAVLRTQGTNEANAEVVEVDEFELVLAHLRVPEMA